MFRYLVVFMIRMLSLFGIVSVLLTSPAYASRFALVIGNGDYRPISNQLKLKVLINPVNDAIDMAAALKSLGFDVILKTNVRTFAAMKKAILEFRLRLPKRGGVGLFYFSGHGFQSENVNYLVPVRAGIGSDIDIEDETLKADYVLRQMERANRQGVNIMILDACRDSIPEDFFEDRNSLFGAELKGGFSDMRAPTGSLIVYPTAPNTTSWGGLPGERNSVYTKHLLNALRQKASLGVTEKYSHASSKGAKTQVKQEIMAIFTVNEWGDGGINTCADNSLY
jgi:uncharacterized caspase-like protein